MACSPPCVLCELLLSCRSGNEEKLMALLTPLNVNCHASDGRKVSTHTHARTHSRTHTHAQTHTNTHTHTHTLTREDVLQSWNTETHPSLSTVKHYHLIMYCKNRHEIGRAHV